jgi:hypothetical protein
VKKKLQVLLGTMFAFYFVVAGNGLGGTGGSYQFTTVGPFATRQACETERAAIPNYTYEYISARCWEGP